MHPILFKIGPVTIYSYGVMIALAFVIGVWLGRERAKKDGIAPDSVLDLGLYVLISGIVGARLLHVLVNINYYMREPAEIVMLHHGGLVFYGGVILALVVASLFLRKKRIPLLLMGDCVIPYVALGQAIGRIGCFLNGCCFGRPTDLPWGIIFPAADVPLHPTQIYLSLNGLLIFMILDCIRERKAFNGQIFLSYFILYPFIRFFLEFFRGDVPATIFGIFTFSQLLSVAMFISAAIIYMKLRIK